VKDKTRWEPMAISRCLARANFEHGACRKRMLPEIHIRSLGNGHGKNTAVFSYSVDKKNRTTR